MSFSRVCLNMNVRSGAVAFSSATGCEILFAKYGCSAVVLISLTTGCMMKNVSSSANPTSTWVGGTCWVPKAVRTNDSTMTIRVNDVTKTSKVGASVKTVSSRRICSDKATSDGLVAGDTPKSILGIVMVGAVG